MRTRNRIYTLFLAALLCCTVCSALGETAAPDYYGIGLEVTRLMGEIVDSEDYLSLFAMPESFSKVRERVNTHDYDRPAAVYAIRLEDPETLVEKLLREEPEALEKYRRLSPALRELILSRLSLPALCARINAAAGAEYMSFFTLANAFIRDDRLTAEETGYYLYFFEKGAPILVSFGYHSASGQFLDIPGEYRDNPAEIQSLLALPGLELDPVAAAEPAAGSLGNLADFGIDPEEALRKMSEFIGERLPAGGIPAYDASGSRLYEVFDITGDGCTDLFTNVTWGSGMVRTDLIVYDPVQEELYVLDGYNYDYLIDHAEENRIVIVKEGPHGYNDPVVRTSGTVELEKRQLIFIADSEEPS